MARQPWRPRHGKKFNENPERSFLEIQFAFIARSIPKFLLHPLWAIVVAALIAGTGRRELFLRSSGFLFVALWLSVDLWVWLLGKKVEADNAWFWQSSKFAIGWTVTSCLLLMVMETMLWGLESQRGEAFKSVWNNCAWSTRQQKMVIRCSSNSQPSTIANLKSQKDIALSVWSTSP